MKCRREDDENDDIDDVVDHGDESHACESVSRGKYRGHQTDSAIKQQLRGEIPEEFGGKSVVLGAGTELWLKSEYRSMICGEKTTKITVENTSNIADTVTTVRKSIRLLRMQAVVRERSTKTGTNVAARTPPRTRSWMMLGVLLATLNASCDLGLTEDFNEYDDEVSRSDTRQ